MKGTGKGIILAGVAACISLLPLVTPVSAANIVIGDHYTAVGSIFIVSPNPGDEGSDNGRALRGTLSGIMDASATKPYLIKLGPGTYDLGPIGLAMKQWISIEGSGEKMTKITGAVDLGTPLNPPTSGTIIGVNNAELRFLAVENTITGTSAAAIFNSSASPSILHVTATVSGGGTERFGVLNYNGSSPAMTNVTAEALGGEVSIGVANDSSSPTMTNVTATASGGTNYNYGVYNNASSPRMTNVTAMAWGGGTSSKYGVFTYSSASVVVINHSVIMGDTAAILNGAGATTRVSNTQLVGGAVLNYGTLTCVGAYNAGYVALNTSCQ